MSYLLDCMDQDRIWIVAPIVQGWMMHLSCYKMDSQVRGWWRKWRISEDLTKSLFLQNLSFQNLLWSYFQCHRLHPPRPRQTCEQNIFYENNTFPPQGIWLGAWEVAGACCRKQLGFRGGGEDEFCFWNVWTAKGGTHPPPGKFPALLNLFPQIFLVGQQSHPCSALWKNFSQYCERQRCIREVSAVWRANRVLEKRCEQCAVWSVKSTQSLREVFAKVFTNPTPLQY